MDVKSQKNGNCCLDVFKVNFNSFLTRRKTMRKVSVMLMVGLVCVLGLTVSVNAVVVFSDDFENGFSWSQDGKWGWGARDVDGSATNNTVADNWNQDASPYSNWGDYTIMYKDLSQPVSNSFTLDADYDWMWGMVRISTLLLVWKIAMAQAIV